MVMTLFAETIVRLDAGANYQAMHDYILAQPEKADELVPVAFQLLLSYRLRGAYMIAQMMQPRVANPILSFALAVGGLTLGNPQHEIDGRRALRAQIDMLPAAAQQQLYLGLEPMIRTLANNAANTQDGHAVMLRVLDLIRDLVPTFRDMFDVAATPPALNIDSLRAEGRRTFRPVALSDPPPEARKIKRRAIVAMRALFFPQNPNSRLFEIGPIMVASMNNYGWNASLVGMKCLDHLAEDFRITLETCLHERADVLMLDEQLIEAPVARAARKQMIGRLRQELPNIKIVALHLDPWSLDTPLLVEAMPDVDAVWTFAPDLPAWHQPSVKDRVFMAPLPHAGDYGGPILPLDGRMRFIGSINAFNWHRFFWLSAAAVTDLPLDTQKSQHVADGLSVVESYLGYIRRLADGRCSVNFSMRPNLMPAITGRTFEILASGSLLVQERAPDLDCFLTAGEHYLSFSSVAELRAIADFIRDKPEQAEEIRRAGNAFFRATFSDDKVIGYLDKKLHYAA